MDLTRVGIYGGSAGGQSAHAGAALTTAISTKSPSPTAAATTTAWTKSGGTNSGWAGRWTKATRAVPTSIDAHKLKGKLLLIVGELDHNVDPASTMQVVNALEKADKDFRAARRPRLGPRRRLDARTARSAEEFLVQNLLGDDAK